MKRWQMKESGIVWRLAVFLEQNIPLSHSHLEKVDDRCELLSLQAYASAVPTTLREVASAEVH